MQKGGGGELVKGWPWGSGSHTSSHSSGPSSLEGWVWNSPLKKLGKLEYLWCILDHFFAKTKVAD